MAITNGTDSITQVDYDTHGGKYGVVYAHYKGPAADIYAAGGEAGLQKALGVSEIKFVAASPADADSQDYGLVWVPSTGKVIWSTEGSEVADNTDLSTKEFDLRVDCIL